MAVISERVRGEMMRYYELFDADTAGILCNSHNLYGIDRLRLFEGKRIDDWDERITLWYERGEVEDYLSNMLHCPVVSTKMREAMERAAPGQAQYLPVQVRHRGTGTALDGYFVVNILQRVKAFDWQRAKYDIDVIDGVEHLTVFRMALLRQAVEPFDILRVDERDTTVIISERVRVALGAAKVTGCIYNKMPVNSAPCTSTCIGVCFT